MNRWILRGALPLVLAVASCGDGDLLPDAQSVQTRDNARSRPSREDELESDGSSQESDHAAQPDESAAEHEAGAAQALYEGGLDSSFDASEPGSPQDGGSALDASRAPDPGVGMDAGEGGQAEALAEAGGEDAQRPDSGTDLTYYRDAKPIIDAKCKPCHYEGGIGPFPLTKYTEVESYASLIAYDVGKGVMPPWHAAGPLGVYVGDRRLNETQKSTLLRWIDQGALEGDPSSAPPAPIAPDRRGLGRVDLSLPIAGPYTPQVLPDDYRCFVLEWPYSTTKYVTGVSIEPTRLQSVHHAILYMEPPSNAASVRAQDRADAGPGFRCFSNSASLSTWLTSYEPGGYGQSVPSGLGFEVRPGSLMVLQVHYNSLNGTGPDSSHVDFELADTVAHVATVQQLIEPLWVLGFMSVPANQPDVVHRWRGRPSGLTSSTYDVHWVDLHMHTLGSRGSVSIIRANRSVEPLLQVPIWDFNWQQTYIFNKPVKLNAGDQLEVECHFDNTAAHQMVVDGQRLSPRNVNWGEGTTDEMCLGNVLVTPAM